jgi:hypothetical protein
MTSFDRPRAESSPALTLVAASKTVTIPKKTDSDFTLIVKHPSVAPARYHASRE